jgi:competence protein ComGC
MDLGMSVEARYGARIFEVATNMLNAAIVAKTNKIDKKLKMVELQLKKYAVDKKNGDQEQGAIQAEGYLVTYRNSLLEKLKNMNK